MARRLTPAQRAAQQAAKAQQRQAQQASQYATIQARQQRNSQNLADYAKNWEAGKIATGPSGEPNPAAIGGRPLDWQEEAYRLQANRGMALSNADAAYQQGQLEQEYGYGTTGAANPYSRAALLEEFYKRSKLGTTNSMASAGQLHSGAYGRAQNENQRQYSIGSDQNRRQYDQAVYGLNMGRAQTAANYGLGVDQATFEALLRALGGQ